MSGGSCVLCEVNNHHVLVVDQYEEMSRRELASKLAKLETKMEAKKSTGGENVSQTSQDYVRMYSDITG